MRKKKILKVLNNILAFCLLGCFPVTQVSLDPDDNDFSSFLDFRHELEIQWKSKNGEGEFLEKSSWATFSDGTKYSLQAQRKDLETFGEVKWSDWKGVTLKLVDIEGRSKNNRWVNGDWKIHFEFKDGNETVVKDCKLRISTFRYNPIVHGPPN